MTPRRLRPGLAAVAAAFVSGCGVICSYPEASEAVFTSLDDVVDVEINQENTIVFSFYTHAPTRMRFFKNMAHQVSLHREVGAINTNRYFLVRDGATYRARISEETPIDLALPITFYQSQAGNTMMRIGSLGDVRVERGDMLDIRLHLAPITGCLWDSSGTYVSDTLTLVIR